MRLEVRERPVRLRAPLETAYGTVVARTLFAVTLGEGRGEAAPLEPYDGVPDAAVRAALAAYADALAPLGEDAPGPEVLECCRAAADLPQALAAVDLALWDRAGRRAGRPVWALLSDDALERVPVNASIAASDRAAAASEAGAAAAAGFGCVKVKVGLGDDAGRVAAVRAAAGPQMALRLDANGAWDVGDAVRMIEALEAAGLELVEEPVHGVEGLRAVREHVAVRIAADETAAEPGGLAPGVADAACLKISSSGGIAALLARATLARAGGMEVYLGSTYDGPLGIAAAVHAAAALRVTLPCGLATLGALEDVDPCPLAPEKGAITVPTAPGLMP